MNDLDPIQKNARGGKKRKRKKKREAKPQSSEGIVRRRTSQREKDFKTLLKVNIPIQPFSGVSQIYIHE